MPITLSFHQDVPAAGTTPASPARCSGRRRSRRAANTVSTYRTGLNAGWLIRRPPYTTNADHVCYESTSTWTRPSARLLLSKRATVLAGRASADDAEEVRLGDSASHFRRRRDVGPGHRAIQRHGEALAYPSAQSIARTGHRPGLQLVDAAAQHRPQQWTAGAGVKRESGRRGYPLASGRYHGELRGITLNSLNVIDATDATANIQIAPTGCRGQPRRDGDHRKRGRHRQQRVYGDTGHADAERRETLSAGGRDRR